MVVYADVLIILNFIVDYFLLKATALITKDGTNLKRLLLASLLGGISSLYIFLPSLFWGIEILLKAAVSAVLTFVLFGFNNIRAFLKRMITLFSVTFSFAGAMIGVWYIFKPYGMVINNSVVYFNISPIFLILFSVAGYFISLLVRRIFPPKSEREKLCGLKLKLKGKTVAVTALIDTGNSLSNPFGDGEVIIADESVALSLAENEEEIKNRFRAIPCSTVSGTKLLDAIRCDSAEITLDNDTVRLLGPIVAISSTEIKGDFKAIINPMSIEESL